MRKHNSRKQIRHTGARGTEWRRAGSSVKPLDAANLVDQTIALWKPRLRCNLSREDAGQIAEKVTGFFNILAEWSRTDVGSPANEN